MAPLVDIIVLVWFLFLLSSGWRKGLLRTLIGPLSLLINIAACYFYFQKTHNLIGTAVAMLLGPFVISCCLFLIIFFWHVNFDKGVPPVFLSRFLGSTLNLVWGSGIAVSSILMVAILPTASPRLSTFKNYVMSSHAYALTEKFIKNKIPLFRQAETVIKTSQDPQELAKFQSEPEFRALYFDPKIQKFLTDRETSNQIQNHDMKGLLSNPVFLNLWQDPELLTKLIKLSQRIAQKESPQTEQSSSPKVYEVK